MKFVQILPHIYHLQFAKPYDTAMHFLRFQEYYESLKYCGQVFTLVDYMEWYSHDYGAGVFSYPEDWSGFNVPSNVLTAVAEANIPDLNKYDIQMKSLIETVKKEERGHPFYFIGTTIGGDKGTLDHEIGHALYFTDEEYHQTMENLLDKMPRKNYDTAWEVLQEMRYHPATCRDEVHAYATTGPCDELKVALTPAIRKPFIKAYKEQRRRFK